MLIPILKGLKHLNTVLVIYDAVFRTVLVTHDLINVRYYCTFGKHLWPQDGAKAFRKEKEKSLNQTLRIWLGTQFSRPTPELGPLQAEF